jgi:multiple sugar transport system permease protein
MFIWGRFVGEEALEWGYILPGSVPGVLAEARGIVQSVLNSLLVAASTTLLCLAVGVLAAYSLARIPIRGSTKFLFYIFLSRLLPPIAILIPVYIVFKTIGLLDTLVSIIFIHASFAMPFFLWILFVHFKSVPQSIEDSARVDGCSRFHVLTKIMIPIAKPGIIAASIFAFMISYNEFIFATTLSQTAASRTASATVSALAFSIGRYSVPLIMAGGVFAILPPIIIVLVFRKTILEGLISIFRR